MAFQQPQRQPAARPVSCADASSPPIFPAAPPSVQLDQQEWILFSPAPRTQTASTERTRTAGRSRLSDFGSLDTAARSDRVDTAPANDDNETEDLDSLDDGLHAFNEPSSSQSPQLHVVEQSGETILPNHDGLGTFPGDSSPVQDRFWQFERYNPRRVRHARRRSSLSRRIDAAELDAGSWAEDEKLQRIEQWRMDQSRALLEEVEKETRRLRRQSRLGSVKNSRSQSKTSIDIPTSAPLPAAPAEQPPQPTESFWQRITRRVIRDLMGFDEETLSIIFGESIISNTSQSAPAVMSPIAQAISSDLINSEIARTSESGSWEEKLLERIAKELGVLVHQLSEHPGAFSTYLRTQDSFDYAGLPTPPAFSASSRHRTHTTNLLTAAAAAPHFRPTLPRQHRHSLATADPSLWGIEEEEEPTGSTEDANLQREREYWEKDLDVKMVFGYLKNRFGPSPNPHRAPLRPPQIPAPATTAAANIGSASTTTPESLRRAALIRHHHPLVSSARRNSIMAQAQTRPPPSPILGRRMSTASSCASQSSKRSKTAHSGSSRNYWDIGAGSVGSIGWGEV